MHSNGKATRIRLTDFHTPPMRAFHMTWLAFFVCFFAWFGIAPLMMVVREELGLTPAQVGNIIIASVAVTIVARLIVGWLCDRIGPRLTYSGLLVMGSMPVMGIGLSQSYEALLLFRLAIGAIGASFVITQYHTSVMFAPNCVGTANATTAGWGNLGGGVTQMVMPLVFSGFLMLGVGEFWGWRMSMFCVGSMCMLMGAAYYLLTQDTPLGNYRDLRADGRMPPRAHARGSFLAACRDYRVWVLFLVYGACFGIELTICNIAALYFFDYFDLSLRSAGMIAGLFGLMNLFARTLGGYFGDRAGIRWGLRGRVRWLLAALMCEGLCLILFSQMTWLPLAVGAMVMFSLFVQMSEGATYSVVPFINRKALGSVAGIIGAGGNAGAVAAGFLFKGSLAWPTALLIIGMVASVGSLLVLTIRFSPQAEAEAQREMDAVLAGAAAGRPERVEEEVTQESGAPVASPA